MSEVWASDIDIIFLNALSSVSVMLLAIPHNRNSEVTRMNGTRYLFSTVFILFDYVNVLAGLGEEELLTCELLESILVGGQALDLFLEP